jgi:hypothetical protein
MSNSTESLYHNPFGVTLPHKHQRNMWISQNLPRSHVLAGVPFRSRSRYRDSPVDDGERARACTAATEPIGAKPNPAYIPSAPGGRIFLYWDGNLWLEKAPFGHGAAKASAG